MTRDKWDWKRRVRVDRQDLKLLLRVDGITLPSEITCAELKVFKQAVVRALGVSRSRAKCIIKPLIEHS